MADYALPLGAPIFRTAKADGTPASGWKLYAYAEDGTTPKTTWASSVMSAENANTNPVVLDSRGEAWVFGSGLYTFILKDDSGNQIWSSSIVLLPAITDRARGLLDDASYSAMRTTLGLGTAATYDAGDGASEVLLLESDGKVPAVDGSQLTNIASGTISVPRGYVSGLVLSYSTTTAFKVAAGKCRDSTDAAVLSLSSQYTKTLSGWAVGSGNGSLQSGLSLATDTWYHVHLIYNATSGVTDVMISTSAASPTLPSGYTLFRRIGSILTNSFSQVTNFTQRDGEVLWVDPPLDVNASGVGTAAVNRTLTVPPDIGVDAIMNVTFANPDGAASLYLSSTSVTDEAAAGDTTAPLATIVAPTASERYAGGIVRVRADSSKQIRTRANLANSSLDIVTLGYQDSRGTN